MHDRMLHQHAMNVLKRILVAILTFEARMMLKRYAPRIIAITGSVGKTTTKDAVYAAIAASMYVRKSEKSFNSELGVPLTILGLENAWRNPVRWLLNIVVGAFRVIVPRPYPAWLVLEVGADRPGDIRRIAAWLRPDVAVLTGVPDMPAHVEYFASTDELVKEKRSLADYLAAGGKLVLNGDDARMRELLDTHRGACVLYGFDAQNQYRASHDEILYEGDEPTGVTFRFEHDGSSLPVAVYGALGRPRVYAALAALAVAEIVGVDAVAAARELSHWSPPPGRMRIIEGIRGAVIVDDTYNASPAAVRAALDTLRHIGHAKRKIAVLGDMLELGKLSAEAHRSVGEYAAVSASLLWTAGLRAHGIADGARAAGMLESKIREFDQHGVATAGSELARELKPGDVVLVKGSQAMRTERIVHALMAHPERSAELLVRQESEWAKR
jgi:UDP-N-acetylmuramyl pentapeptide synthase